MAALPSKIRSVALILFRHSNIDQIISRTDVFDNNFSCSQDFWDNCMEAGPKTRPQTPFAKPLPTLNLLAFSDGTATNLT